MTGLVAGAASHPGPVRDNNEDSHLLDPERQIFIVADGMGGHAAGEVASQLAVKSVHAGWASLPMRRRAEAYADRGDADARRVLFQMVREQVMNAHLEIVAAAAANPGQRGMGTTFTGFLVAGGDAIFGHAGDSRAYLVRDGIAIQLSEDHTVLARLRAAGVADELDPEESESRWSGVLTNALGIGDVTRVATFVVPLYVGDRLVLCSDGVHELWAEHDLGRAVGESTSPALAANLLVDQALVRGGTDNATAVVVKVLETGETHVPVAQRDREARVIERAALFDGLTAQERLRALRITTPRELGPGRELAAIALGDRVAYVVLEGEVVASRGRRLGPGGLVYPEALIAGTALPAAPATAATEVRLLTIRRNDFVELGEEEPDLGVKLYAALARLMAG